MAKQYRLTEIFYSIQGEGVMVGTPMMFVRFSGCNRQCRKDVDGFDCDTDHAQRMVLRADEICQMLDAVRRRFGQIEWVLLTGGEPCMQVDAELIDALRDAGWRLAMETNGTIAPPRDLDWITVSPKRSGPLALPSMVNEVKYVLGVGDPIPASPPNAHHRIISPASNGAVVDMDAVRWCIDLLKGNPSWRLSVQLHKLLGIR